MARLKLLLLSVIACLLARCGGSGGDDGPWLVRVRVLEMGGPEPGTLTSDSHPHLFTLDPRVAHVELTFVNAIPQKNDLGPGTWQPTLGPSPPEATPGYIQLTITPAVAQPLSYGRITYTTEARFANNPSSLRLQSSEDGFAGTLSVIPLDRRRTESVELVTSSSDAPFSFRWEAHNDFGEAGGGEAGFAGGDVFVTEAPP
jgi:hypothetical protein